MIKNILIIAFLFFSALKADFIRDNKREIVNDTTTCLMWQDDIATKTFQITWQEAMEYCNDLNFIEFSDWRLPNINELNSISDKNRYNPTIKYVFDNVASDRYWSSTTSVSFIDFAWNIDFSKGQVSGSSKTISKHIRCVRSGQ